MKVGPREQGIPEFAHNGLGSRWFYLRLFSVNHLKKQPHIVSVYRQLIYQAYDKNANWIDKFVYSEDYEVYNSGQFRSGNGQSGMQFDSLNDAYEFATKRFENLKSKFPILEDATLINRLQERFT